MNYLMMYISKKTSCYIKILGLLCCIIFIQSKNTVIAQDIVEPFNPPRLVNDYTSSLSIVQKHKLEEKLLNLEQKTSVQIAVVIIPTLNGYDISDYAFRLGEKWGVGTKDNNGIVFLTSLGEKKVFIASGYGLEDILPDAYIKRIITQNITPYYKNGDIYKGINAGLDTIINIIQQNYKGTPTDNKTIKMLGIPSIGILLFIIISIIIFRATSRQFYHITSPKNNHHTAGGEGKLLSWFLLSMLLNRSRTHRDVWQDFNSGTGDAFGGSDGFGGFNGGKFGGGGAGDNW